MKIEHSVYMHGDSAPWLVMIHGFGGTKKMWKHQIEEFRNSFNLIVLELPGHGDSVWGLSEHREYGFGDVAEDIVEMLHAHGIQKADFLCLSLGSLVMAAIVSGHSEIVNSVLMCGAVFGMRLPVRMVMRLGNILKLFMPFMFSVRLFAYILLPKKAHAKSRKFLVSECRKLGRAEFLRWYSLLVHEQSILGDSIQCFNGIKSLVIMGTEDYIFIREAVRSAASSAGNIAIGFMKNCGHVCCLQNWRDFNRLASQFFLPPAKSQENTAV